MPFIHLLRGCWRPGRIAVAVAGVVVVLVTIVLVSFAASLTGGPLATAPAHAATTTVCSWYGEADQRDVNIGAPDLAAEYLYGPLVGLGGNQIEITGSYPHARYFSFTLYGNNEQATASIYDQQIKPDPGSFNPFTGSGEPGQPTNYTVHVLFANPPVHPAQNTIYAWDRQDAELGAPIRKPAGNERHERDRVDRPVPLPAPVEHLAALSFVPDLCQRRAHREPPEQVAADQGGKRQLLCQLANGAAGIPRKSDSHLSQCVIPVVPFFTLTVPVTAVPYM
jgi:hypothetical protein